MTKVYLPTPLLQVFRDIKLRNALRLYFVLKRIDSRSVRMEAVKNDLPGFSPYQLRSYLAALRQAKLIWQSRGGRVFLAGRRALRDMFAPGHGSLTFEEIPDAALESGRAWTDYLAGVLVKTVGRRLRAYRYERISHSDRKYGTSPTVGGETMPVDRSEHWSYLSCENIRTNFPCAKSTASRWRKRAANSGQICHVRRWQLFSKSTASPAEMRSQVAQAYGSDLAQRIRRMSQGFVIDQPSLVTWFKSTSRRVKVGH